MQRGLVRSPALVVLFSIITCGIYNLYWIYKTSEETQKYSGEVTTSPGLEVLFCIITCGIYSIYWYYKYGKLMTTCQKRAGMQIEDNAVLYLVLSIFGLAIVSAAIMQSNLNRIWESNVTQA